MVDFIEIDGEKIIPIKTLFEDKVMWRNYDTGDLELNLDLLKEYHINLFEYFLENPEEYIEITKNSIKETLEVNKEKYDKQGNLKEVSTLPKNILNFKIINFPKSFYIPIANLRSQNLNKIVILKGILRMVLKSTSKVENLICECPSCGTVMKNIQEENNIKIPTKCSCGRKSGFRILKEEYKNIQQMEVEELIDEIGSRQPQRIRILLEDNLTDPDFNKLQAGNKVEIIGILKKMPKYISEKEKDKVVIEYMIKVIGIKAMESLEEDYYINEEDVIKFKKFSEDNPLQKLADSLAPTIDGLDYLKKSIILFLAKGVTKYLPKGERKRGEIHMLVVSDPGLAKTTLAQNIRKKVVNCRLADGKGSSRAGLVWAITKDPITDRYGLEAGDIVLANKGYLIIDEFDKISEEDREAIHTPMELGESPVTKVIHATLKAETSILALANPRTSSFSPTTPMVNQIDLPSSLMSRFDLIFGIKDNINKEEDKKRALRILKVHRGEINQENVDVDFIKKYILYCSKLNPTLSSSSDERISELFSKLRQASIQNGKVIGIPINNRHMEAIIRMSEAHAKLRLSPFVEDIDIDIAEELFILSLNQFGYDEESKVYDLSRITTKIKPTKKDKYYSGLEILKDLFKIKIEIDSEEIIREFQSGLGINYPEASELLDLLHRQGEIFENKGLFKINSKNL